MEETQRLILSELKKFNTNLENLATAMSEIVDRMDARSEKSLLDLYEVLLRFKALEEHLGIMYINPRKEKSERYVKAKKSGK